MTSTPPRKTNRRKFRLKLSLRTAMVLFVFAALLCWWVQRSEAQRRHCAKVSTYQSSQVGWHFEDISSAWISWLPRSVWNFRGGHYFRNVDSVCYSYDYEADEAENRESWRALLPLLPNCRKINFSEIKLHDYHCHDLARARSLETLYFLDASAPDNLQVNFPEFPKLKSLSILEPWRESNQFLTECFDNLSASRDLREVNINYGTHLIVDRIVENLRLEHCILESDLISDEAIEKLSHLPLKTLKTTSPLSDKAAASIAKIKTLESIELQNSKITDDGVRSLASLPNLRDISLHGCLASPAIGKCLASAKKLESIEIGRVFIEDQTAKQLLSLPKLKELKVMPQCLTAEALADLSSHTLMFSGPPGPYIDKAELQKKFENVKRSSNPKLTAFINFSAALPRGLKRQLKSLNITGDEPELLEAQRLHLSGSDIDDDDLVDLAKFQSLKSLDLSNTQVTDAGITELLKARSSETSNKLWPQLESLNLRATRTKKAWIKFASQLPNLSSLDLSATDVTDEDLAYIAPGFFSSLQEINLAETEISHNGLRNLTRRTALYFIDIQDTSIGDEAIETLLACEMVWGLKTRHTSLTYAGAQKIAKTIGPFQYGETAHYSIPDYHITEPFDPTSIRFPNRGFNRFNTFIIDGENLNFDQLRPLLQVERIESLTFKKCDVTPDELVTLAAGTKYKLELCGKFCEASWLAAIAGRPELKCSLLHLRHENLGLDHLHAIKNWKQLKRLSLSGGKWNRKTLEQLSQLPVMANLETLKFIDTEIERDALLGLKGHPSLNFVETPNFTLDGADCDWIFRGKIGGNRSLSFRVGDHNFSEIFQSLPCDARTRRLEINAKNFTADDWSNLTRLQFITYLEISDVDIDNAVIDSISQLPFLKNLNLTKVEIDDAGLRRLNEISNLKNLTFNKTDFSGVDWRQSLAHCQISSITFNGCDIAPVFGALPPIICPTTGHRIRVTQGKSRD